MDVNKFDEKAATWDDDPAKVTRAARGRVCRARAVPVTTSTRMLEYGAGTGLVTQALRDFVGPVTLVDTSVGMRDVMHAKIAAGAIIDARVWDVDLATAPAPDERFDLIVTVLTLHHIPTLDRVLANFAELLVDGGHLCVADLEKEDGSFHGEGFDGHHGFGRSEIESQLHGAGFTDVSVERCCARARRPFVRRVPGDRHPRRSANAIRSAAQERADTLGDMVGVVHPRGVARTSHDLEFRVGDRSDERAGDVGAAHGVVLAPEEVRGTGPWQVRPATAASPR